MFGRKKKEQEKAQFNLVDDSRVTAYDFRRRLAGLFESYRPMGYRVYRKLTEEEMKPRLDGHLEALFSGEVDDANGDMLDNIIFGSYREAVSDLNIQRLSHKDMCRRLIARRSSDRDDFAEIRSERQEELSHLEQEYEDICRKMKEAEEA